MANVNNPFNGTWIKDGVAGVLYVFRPDGGISIDGDIDYNYLVWESGTTHTLLTASGDANTEADTVVTVYSFTVNANGTITVSGNAGFPFTGVFSPPAGTTNTPAPLVLTNQFLGAWNVDAVTTGMESGPWVYQYDTDGLVVTTHVSMGATFDNSYLVRNTVIVTLGNMRFNPFKVGDIITPPPAGYPIVVVEPAGTSASLTWYYTR